MVTPLGAESTSEILLINISISVSGIMYYDGLSLSVRVPLVRAALVLCRCLSAVHRFFPSVCFFLVRRSCPQQTFTVVSA